MRKERSGQCDFSCVDNWCEDCENCCHNCICDFVVEDNADIKKPFSAPVTLKEIAPWLLGIILIAALAFLVIYAISRRNKNKPLFQEHSPQPRHMDFYCYYWNQFQQLHPLR